MAFKCDPHYGPVKRAGNRRWRELKKRVDFDLIAKRSQSVIFFVKHATLLVRQAPHKKPI
jgi:hypothetical protein